MNHLNTRRSCIHTAMRSLIPRISVLIFLLLLAPRHGFGAVVKIDWVWLVIVPTANKITLLDLRGDLKDSGELVTAEGNIPFQIRKAVDAPPYPSYLEGKLSRTLEVDSSLVSGFTIRFPGERFHFCPQDTLQYTNKDTYGILAGRFTVRPGWIPRVDTFNKDPLSVIVTYKACSSQVTNTLGDPSSGPVLPDTAIAKFELLYPLLGGRCAFPFDKVDLGSIRKDKATFHSDEFYTRARWIGAKSSQSPGEKDALLKVIKQERPVEKVQFSNFNDR